MAMVLFAPRPDDGEEDGSQLAGALGADDQTQQLNASHS